MILTGKVAVVVKVVRLILAGKVVVVRAVRFSDTHRKNYCSSESGPSEFCRKSYCGRDSSFSQ